MLKLVGMMMKYVKLITGITVEEVPLMGRSEIPYIQPDMRGCRPVGDAVIDLNAVQDIENVRVALLRESNRPDLYMAYTKQVESLLGVPMRTIIREKDELEYENKKLECRNWELCGRLAESNVEISRQARIIALVYKKNWWERLKYLVTGRI